MLPPPRSAVATLIACGSPPPANTVTLTINPPGAHRWTRQFSTSSGDFAFGIATDANGNTYTTGETAGALEGSNAGSADAFIRSNDS